ncbi:MAG: NFACT family protein [Oscillospiraceae bacterium]|nr:NFACT family protein [Oscillospiraceae bacterium]
MLDGTFLLAVKQELEELVDGRIDKIHQPSRDEAVISFRTKNGGKKVLISSSGTSGRIHITNEKIENPAVPPMFCMLLRKKLTGGRLAAVRQEGLERILYLDIDTTNELGDREMLTLIVEIMGKYSNLILTDPDGKIIDALRRLDDITAERLILPGVTYTPPERRKRLNFLTTLEDDLYEAVSSLKGTSAAKAFIGAFEGISPVLAREWIYRAAGTNDIPCEELTEGIRDKLVYEIVGTRNRFFAGDRKYCILRENGVNKDLCFDDITQYDGIYEKEYFESAGALLDSFYSERDRVTRLKQRYQEIYRLTGSLYDKVLRRLDNRRTELAGTEKKELYRLYGDLISANLYKMQKGDKELVCENIYDEALPQVKIKLDERLTPSQNMQRMYKEYRKADIAANRLEELIKSDETEKLYLESVRDIAERIQTEAEIEALRAELAEQGYIRTQGRKERPKPLKPLEYTSPDGFRILVGRNNKQNDELTHKIAKKTDIWLHVKDFTGAHVIILADGAEVPEKTIRYAAKLAAEHSSAKASSQVPVDYVQARFVKKPAGARPGMVIFTNNRTLYV